MSEAALNEDDLFGTAKYGGEGFKKAKKLDKGDTTVRILPPLKSQRETGKWKIFHRVHFGYEGTNKKDPTSQKGWAKPFLCVEEKDRQTKMITRECPECVLIKKRQGERDDRKQQIKMALKVPDEKALKEAWRSDAGLKAIEDWLYKHNLDMNFFVNAKFENGEVGPLQVRYKAMLALDKVFEELRKKKVDPIHPGQGVWVTFNREGEKIGTTYTCKVTNEKVIKDGEEFERRKAAPLSAEDRKKISVDAVDLLTAHQALDLSEAQIKALTESDDDREVVDSIIGQTVPAGQTAGAQVPQDEGQPDPEPTPTPKSESKPATPAAGSAAAPAEDDEEAKLLAQLAEARKRKEAAKVAAAKPPPVVAASDLENIDAEKFIQEYGDPAQE